MIKTLKTSQILPSQDFLKDDTIKHILDLIHKNKLGDLPPTPIVVAVGDVYVALDGHNLVAVMDFLNRDIKVFVASSKTDKVAGNNAASTGRNKEIMLKFDKILENLKTTQSKGIHDFTELRKKYSELFK